MKKLFLIAGLLTSSVCTFAQHQIGSWNFQPKVGLNVATLTDTKDSDPRFGVAVGAEVEYQVNEFLSFSGGALYSMQGAKFDNTLGSSTIKVDYINVPIMANFYIAKGLAVKFGIQPGFNMLAKTTNKTDISVWGFNYKNKSDNEIEAESFDFSIPLGMSYEFNNFCIDARYNLGATKVFDGSDSKNGVFQLTLGYKIDL
ncbi:MAG: PorT family protein [Prevotella sp.]|nr:PorT family protein [Prevotella sp.]